MFVSRTSMSAVTTIRDEIVTMVGSVSEELETPKLGIEYGEMTIGCTSLDRPIGPSRRVLLLGLSYINNNKVIAASAVIKLFDLLCVKLKALPP